MEEYEEKVIDGILHHKGKSTSGQWIPFTVQELTLAYKAMFYSRQREQELAKEFKRRLCLVQDAVKGLELK